jgi:hypothetical protein
MTPTMPTHYFYLLHKGGPSLLDLKVDSNDVHVLVTGPGMLFSKLRLLTSLSIFEGCDIHRLHEFAQNIEVIGLCGAVGIFRVNVTIEVHRTGAALEIDLGPTNMYQTELILRTRSGETFKQLLVRLLSNGKDEGFSAALYPVTATGHAEHFHGEGEPIENSDQEHQHTGEDHEHS